MDTCNVLWFVLAHAVRQRYSSGTILKTHPTLPNYKDSLGGALISCSLNNILTSWNIHSAPPGKLDQVALRGRSVQPGDPEHTRGTGGNQRRLQPPGSPGPPSKQSGAFPGSVSSFSLWRGTRMCSRTEKHFAGLVGDVPGFSVVVAFV